LVATPAGSPRIRQCVREMRQRSFGRVGWFLYRRLVSLVVILLEKLHRVAIFYKREELNIFRSHVIHLNETANAITDPRGKVCAIDATPIFRLTAHMSWNM
jgi:hypothetical protein